MPGITALANPHRFQKIAPAVAGLASVPCVGLFLYGLYLALVASPPDYLQSETVRIMYIHVPAAWLSLFIYASMGAASFSYLIWKHMLAGLYISAAAPVGAAITAICLVTGALWGKPTWGTYWVWDARLTSVLVLLFLYAGIMALLRAFDRPEKGLMAAAALNVAGLINLPVIKFSVDWWTTLHQPASISSLARIANPALAPEMLSPLLVMAGAYFCFSIAVVTLRLQNELRARKLGRRLFAEGNATA